MIEVNVDLEEGKSGVLPDQLDDVVAGIRALAHLRLDGLMAIPMREDGRSAFARMREFASRFGLKELSMGMSEEFEAAIEEGSTMVRVGRAIFGERERREKEGA